MYYNKQQKMDNLNYRLDREPTGQIKHRWGSFAKQQQQESSLLIKKDLQIKRLQSQLQNERKRADNAMKMLDSFKNSNRIQEQSSFNTKSEITKRLKAEQETRKLRAENETLKSLLLQQITALEGYQKDMVTISNK